MAAGALILSIQGLSLWWMGRRPELADLASHGACATGTLALTYGVYGVGLPGVITVYFSSLIVLSAAHILGRQAACLWAVPSLVLIAATVFAPPTVIRDVDPVVTFDNPTQTAESWIAAADDAMYAAKRAGGRRIYRCSASGVEEVL